MSTSTAPAKIAAKMMTAIIAIPLLNAVLMMTVLQMLTISNVAKKNVWSLLKKKIPLSIVSRMRSVQGM